MNSIPRRAVLVYFKEYEDGTKLTLDDVVLQPGQQDIWKKDVLYTFKAMSKGELEKLEFSDKELADFGFHVLARLSAFLRNNSI